MSDGPGGEKTMKTCKAETTFVDLTQHCPESVSTNAEGWGCFPCQGGSISIWIPEEVIPEALRSQFNRS